MVEFIPEPRMASLVMQQTLMVYEAVIIQRPTFFRPERESPAEKRQHHLDASPFTTVGRPRERNEQANDRLHLGGTESLPFLNIILNNPEAGFSSSASTYL
jgi:hypothetical protein